MQIRTEQAQDRAGIAELIGAAFRDALHKTGREAQIVADLRAAGALQLSLVAEAGPEDRGPEDRAPDGAGPGTLLGHIAVSPAQIGAVPGWGLIGPLAVRPDWQGRGIGAALMRAALGALRAQPGCPGAVLVGYPAYYGRFGFASFPDLGMPGVPQEAVMALPFTDAAPHGVPLHHAAFGLDQR
jgi:putative acetyltransferase